MFTAVSPFDENLDIGSDTGTPVDDADYAVPFAFTGGFGGVTLAAPRARMAGNGTYVAPTPDRCFAP